MFVVIVDFVIKPDHIADFMRAMEENAAASVAHEPGCYQFDVCVDPNDASRVFLYEVYEDADAFKAHLAAPHFTSFDARVGPWLADKVVRTFHRVAQNSV